MEMNNLPLRRKNMPRDVKGPDGITWTLSGEDLLRAIEAQQARDGQ
jgi:hypothetical protein